MVSLPNGPHAIAVAYFSPFHTQVPSSHLPPPFKPPTTPHNRNRLIHHPLAHAQVAIDPGLEFFICVGTADAGGRRGFESEAGTPLDTSEECGYEDGVEGVVG